jgi:undecaprenyl diphosphate synthase
MQLFKMYLSGQRERMVAEGVRLDSIGNISKLSPDVREVLEETKIATAGGTKINLVLALNYGARDDICRAAVALIGECENGNLKKDEISEQVFSRYLDTAKWGDPELLIRTSGERRLSNFLLWQISYAEVYVTDVLWPDFNEEELVQAIAEYQRRDRRIGG